MGNRKLKKAPLKEVIFELRWEGAADLSGVQIDKGFDLAQGKFAAKQEREFPVYRKLVPENLPFRIFGSPVNQFWKSELEWPVVQHGQGILAINDVEASYEWEGGFFPLVTSTLERLMESYGTPMKFNRIKLHYIDAWDIDEGHPIDFMRNNLQTDILTDYHPPGKLRNYTVQQGFDLEEGSVLSLSISSGTNNQSKKNSVVWNTVVEKVGRIEKGDVIPWLVFAHKHTSEMFKNMLTPEFYASLDR